MKSKNITLVLMLFTAFLFVGCKPVKEIQYIDRYHEVLKTDSIYKYQKDTTYLTRSGDTVFVNHFSTKIDYKYKYINKTDTVTKTETKIKKEVEVKEKKVTRWVSWIDWGLIGIALLYGLFRLLKFLKIIP